MTDRLDPLLPDATRDLITRLLEDSARVMRDGKAQWDKVAQLLGLDSGDDVDAVLQRAWQARVIFMLNDLMPATTPVQARAIADFLGKGNDSYRRDVEAFRVRVAALAPLEWSPYDYANAHTAGAYTVRKVTGDRWEATYLDEFVCQMPTLDRAKAACEQHRQERRRAPTTEA